MDSSKVISPKVSKRIRADLLKFGDIILSSGYGLKDTFVVLATRENKPERKYSHAAMVFAPGIWLESTGDGTGLTYFHQEYVSDDVSQKRVIDTDHYRTIDVFRLENAEFLCTEWHSDEFQAVLEGFVGFEYPSLDALAETTKWLAGTPRVKRSIMAALTANRDIANPGAFCSQLVVDLFKALNDAGLMKGDLLKHQSLGHTISPNDLADSDFSNLNLKTGIITTSPDVMIPKAKSQSILTESLSADNAFLVEMGNSFRANLVAAKRGAVVIEKNLDAVAKMADQGTAENATRMKELGYRLLLTEDEPEVLDSSDNPQSRKIQEDILNAGMNPGWIRLEGLASYFAKQTEDSSAIMRTCVETIDNFSSAFTGLPKSRVRAVIVEGEKWISLTPQVFAEFTRFVSQLENMKSTLLHGFESDIVWIKFINETAKGHIGLSEAFISFLDQAKNILGEVNPMPVLARRAAARYQSHLLRLSEEVLKSINATRQFAADWSFGQQQ